MKICLISNLFPPISRGGAEKVALTVARGLCDRGHDVFVISTKPWDGWDSLKSVAKEEAGIKVYRFYPFNIFYYLNDYRHNIFWRMKWHSLDVFNCHSRCVVKNILKQEKPDMVMTHNLKGIGYLIPGMIHRLGIKHIHVLHDVQLAVPSGLIIKGEENNWQQKIFLRKWYEAICRRLFNSPDIVVSPSRWLMNFYTEKGFFQNSKKVVLPNPIGLRQAQAINNDSLSERSESNGLQLFYLGQIEEHKGILFLVEVLKKMDDVNFKLHIAGDGNKMKELKKIVNGDNRFIIHGMLSQEKISEIFSLVDFTIVPSLCYENSPTVIYESLAVGVPVVAAKIGGVAELIRDGEEGFTFEPGNADNLVKILKYCAVHLDDIQKMRRTAQKSVENFSIEKYINKLLSL